MASRQEKFGVGDDDQIKPRSKRRPGKPTKGYQPAQDQNGFGTRKNARRPDVEEDDDYLDLEDGDFEDEDFDDEDFEDEDFDDEDFDDDFGDLDDPDDLL